MGDLGVAELEDVLVSGGDSAAFASLDLVPSSPAESYDPVTQLRQSVRRIDRAAPCLPHLLTTTTPSGAAALFARSAPRSISVRSLP
jgi:hypothetical protein